jgi:hypothetical protein
LIPKPTTTSQNVYIHDYGYKKKEQIGTVKSIFDIKMRSKTTKSQSSIGFITGRRGGF